MTATSSDSHSRLLQTSLVLVLVIGKTLLDLKLHRRAHTKSVAAGN